MTISFAVTNAGSNNDETHDLEISSTAFTNADNTENDGDGNGELNETEFNTLLETEFSELDSTERDSVVDSVFGDSGVSEFGDVTFDKLDEYIGGATINSETGDVSGVSSGEGEGEETIEPGESGVEIRTSVTGGTYVDDLSDENVADEDNPIKQLETYLANGDTASVTTFLADMGFGNSTEFADLLIQKAGGSVSDVLSYLQSYDGAMGKPNERQAGDDSNISSGEIVMSLITSDEGYDLDAYREAYEAADADGQRHLVRSVLYAEGYDDTTDIFSNEFADLSNVDEVMEKLFGVTSGTVTFGEIPDTVGNYSVGEGDDLSRGGVSGDTNGDGVVDENDEPVDGSDEPVDGSGTPSSAVEDYRDDDLYIASEDMQDNITIDEDDQARLEGALGDLGDKSQLAAAASLLEMGVDIKYLVPDEENGQYTETDFKNIVGTETFAFGTDDSANDGNDYGRAANDAALKADLFFRMMGTDGDNRYPMLADYDGKDYKELYADKIEGQSAPMGI